MRFDTLSAIVEAVGGKLLVQICFADGATYRLKIDEENAVSLKS